MNPATPPHGAVDWSSLPRPEAQLRCVVVMPVRNESARLAAALQALSRQPGPARSCEVLVLANNCTDDSAELARVAGRASSVPIHVVEARWSKAQSQVGFARRLLMDEAAARLRETVDANRGLILSTDGDTRVAPDWLAANVRAVDAGADAIGGRILVDDQATLAPAVRRLMRLDDLYRRLRARLESVTDPDPADPWPRHHQHFGASLCVTVEAYESVSARPWVPYLEDEVLIDALRLEDRAIRHAPEVRVRTSARLDGRAEVGLSWQLRDWAGLGADLPRVPDPRAEAEVWRLRAAARVDWRHARPDAAGWMTFGRHWQAERRDAAELPSLGMDAAVGAIRTLLRADR